MQLRANSFIVNVRQPQLFGFDVFRSAVVSDYSHLDPIEESNLSGGFASLIRDSFGFVAFEIWVFLLKFKMLFMKRHFLQDRDDVTAFSVSRSSVYCRHAVCDGVRICCDAVAVQICCCCDCNWFFAFLGEVVPQSATRVPVSENHEESDEPIREVVQ